MKNPDKFIIGLVVRKFLFGFIIGTFVGLLLILIIAGLSGY